MNCPKCGASAEISKFQLDLASDCSYLKGYSVCEGCLAELEWFFPCTEITEVEA